MSNPSNTTVPACSAHVSAGSYSATAQANFNPLSWNQYYKNVVISAQVLPGLIFGVLCWIGFVLFIVYLLTLCCRSVAWRSRRSRTLDQDDPRRNQWAIFNVVTTLVTLGVIASCVWALITGIHTTDGQIQQVWGIVGNVQSQLGVLSTDVSQSATSLQNLGTSVNASYNLVNQHQTQASAAGIDVPDTLSVLSSLSTQLANGQDGTTAASDSIQADGITRVQNFQSKWQHSTEKAWQTYRPIIIAVFFGLLIIFGIFTGFLAVLDRTPRTTVLFTLLLLLWTGFVLFLGTGLLNVLWRVSRDACLYGITYAANKFGGSTTTQTIFNYYFQKTYIAPQDVSQELFGFNLTSTIQTLSDQNILNLVNKTQTTQGQLFVAAYASAQDQASINALPTNLGYLSGNLTSLNNDIQASAFASITNGVMSLICCSLTTALWELWLASTITGALSGLLCLLAVIKTVTAVQRVRKEPHFTPESPNKLPQGTNTPSAPSNPKIPQGTNTPISIHAQHV